MPTYEYACKTCGHRFEAWQKFSDEPLTECPECHNAIHRVLFPAGVVFKGGGFYSTDTRKGGDTAALTGSNGAKADKAETKTETKTEAKPETTAGATGDAKPAASSDTAKAS